MLVSCRLRRPTILEFYGKSSPTFNKLILIYFLRSFLASAFLKTVASKLCLFKSICKFYIVLCMLFVILIGCIFINFWEVCHACRFWFVRMKIWLHPPNEENMLINHWTILWPDHWLPVKWICLFYVSLFCRPHFVVCVFGIQFLSITVTLSFYCVNYISSYRLWYTEAVGVDSWSSRFIWICFTDFLSIITSYYLLSILTMV